MKFLEIPDFHYSPQWLEHSKSCAVAVGNAAREHGVDYIATVGDLHDKALYASDKSGYEELIRIVEAWTNVRPVLAIEGTPGHDAPGSYAPLERAGLTLLKPGEVYRDIPGAIIFGVPELNKKNIQAQLNLSADEANAAAAELFCNYVDQFVSPNCAASPDAVHHMLFHGNFSDARQENEADIVLRASDIVIHTERLVYSGLDRISLGHIHTPWESEKISAGYAGFNGMDANPWGKRDFVPAFNLVEVEPGQKPAITRIPYGSPMRKKIFAPLENYDQSIAYWLETEDPTAERPAGHPWSRITIEEKRKESRRISQEDAQQISTLADLFEAIDPEVRESVLKKVSEIQESIKKESTDHKDIRLLSVEVAGSVFFKKSSGKENIKMDYAGLPAGLTVLLGDNGEGKSSLLSFSSPYPVVIGKDTKSGRASAIKDFFNSKDSWIEKRLTLNGVEHHHKITIRGAHTQSAKVECYLNIEGQPVLDKGTFDEMLEKCEELYGSLDDFLLTYFYVQPLQSSSFSSSLMSAKMSEIRNLVQTIAGIDRTAELRHALTEKSIVEKSLEDATTKSQTAVEFLEDMSAIKAERDVAQSTLDAERSAIEKLAQDGKAAKEEKEKAEEAAAEAYRQKAARAEAEAAIQKLQSRIASLKEKEADLKKTVSGKDQDQKLLDDFEKLSALKAEKKEIDDKNEEARNSFDISFTEADHKKKGLLQGIDSRNNRIKFLTKQAEEANNPCEHCGKNSSTAEKTIQECKAKIERAIAENKTDLVDMEAIVFPDEPVYKLFDKEEELSALSSSLAFVELNELKARLKTADTAEVLLDANAQQLKDAEQNRAQAVDPESITWDETAAARKLEAVRAYDEMVDKYRTASAEIAKLEERVNGIDERIQRAEEQKRKAEQLKATIPTLEAELEDWKYIAAMLQPAKIPALELDLVADTIDMFANENLKHYQGNRYMITTTTQQQGKAGAVDKFDISVLDKQTGVEDSFLRHSPGQKAFFNDAYVKALVRVRNNRNNITYSPVVLDEADAPVQPERLQEFYDMQLAEYSETSAVVVSHNPEAHNYIQNHIYIKELMR